MTHIFRTLEYLTKHLYRVAARYAETGMTAKNVAIVWAPNLLRCKSLEVGGVAALQGVGIQAGDQYSITVSRQKSIFKKTQFFFKILNKVWCPIYRGTPLNHTLVKHEWKGSELEIMPTVPLKISFIISSSSRIFDENIRIFIKYWPPWNLGGCDRISNKILRAYILGYGTKPNLAQSSFRGRNLTGRGPTICPPPFQKIFKVPFIICKSFTLKTSTSHLS